MTSDCFNLSEFSEYLDDTDGHRLAQFLQKKSGTVRNGVKRIFDAEPQRFSLNVRLKRVSSPPVQTAEVENENECVIPETQDADKENDVQNKEHTEVELSPEQEVLQQESSQVIEAQSLVTVDESLNNTEQNGRPCKTVVPVMLPIANNKTCPETKSMVISPVKSPTEQCTIGPKVRSPSKISEALQLSILAEENEPNKQMEEPPLPMIPVSPQQLEALNLREKQAVSARSGTFLQSKIPCPIIPKTPRSKLSRSGGLRSGDRLRRQVLKRISNLENNGRRTLLSEFESTLCSSNFSPAICSTPMHHTPPANLLKTPPRINNSLSSAKTPPRLNNSLNRPKTPEINACIPNEESLQHTQNNAVKQPQQKQEPLIKNMVEALEETIKKLKSFENPPHTRAVTPESSINTTDLQQPLEQLQQEVVPASTDNEVAKSNMTATEALLQEVQKTLTDLRHSNLQAPKIVIPVNQTFNNAPPTVAADKQIGGKESNPECEGDKVTQSEAQADQTIGAISRKNIHGVTFSHSHCTQKHTITAANLNGASNFNSPNHPINHPTFTCNNTTTKTNLPTDSVQYKNVTRLSGNQKAATDNNKPNTTAVHSISLNESNKRRSTRSAHTTLKNKNLEVNFAKPQSFVNHDTSKCATLNNRAKVPTEAAAQASIKHSLTEKTISQLLTDDEDEEEDMHYTVNKRQILRKSGPLNLATEKPQTTKRNRRTIKRTMRTRIHHPSTKAFASSPFLTSDTETESGPPPAHPLNLQHVKPVEHTKVQQLRRRRPLNKAPSTPKNGELFADELKAHLARLTNHEILDLRKRNSMGLMNGKYLRKSSGANKQALEQKLKIEEEIQLEILRRELLGNTEGLRGEVQQQTDYDEINQKNISAVEAPLATEVVEVIKEIILDELPQAPAAFKDNTTIATDGALLDNATVTSALLKDNTADGVAKLTEDNCEAAVAVLETENNVVDATVTPDVPEPFKDNSCVDIAAPNVVNTNDNGNALYQTLLQLTQRICYNSSLVDDRSSERITFVSTTVNNVQNTTKARKTRQRSKHSEALPEVTRKYFQLEESIKTRRQYNRSKRSLYSKGDSLDEDSEASDSEKDKFQKNSTLTEPIPPPPVISPVSNIQIPSPPPPLGYSTVSTFVLPSLPTEEFVLPPTAFSDKPMDSSANGAKSCETLSASHNNTAAKEVVCQNDDELFKKPTKLAPRVSRKRRPQNSKTYISSNLNQTERTDDTEGLRRSKRAPSNPSSNWNGHSLLKSLFNSSSLNKTKKKPIKRASSSSSNGSRGGDLSTPVASSTVNDANVKKRTRKPKKKGIPQAPAFSYLGDTNITSNTVHSQRNTESYAMSAQLEAIPETPIETDDHEAAVASSIAVAPAPNDNTLPCTSTSITNKNMKTTTKTSETTTNRNKKTGATEEQTAKPKKRGRPRRTVTGAKKNQQQQQQQQREEVDAVEAAEQITDDDTANGTGLLECSRVYLPPPPSLEKLNEMFDELKNAANNLSDGETMPKGAESSTSPSTTDSNVRLRPVRVRLRRLRARDISAATSTSAATSSASTSTSNSEFKQTAESNRKELLEWLKNVSHLQSATNERQVFMDMRPSTAGKLFFTDLEGIDYAFYDTDDKCSLGYLRFKPLQCKPSKRAKKYHLHFVVLTGSFEISTERESANFGVGDMVAINIGCRYKITNLENDIGVLMVIKK
ncbi:uncharacterized protein LOC120773508 [Bactrocera tryoni]|uniref:uncharacterized protein LOC120773508 n=1 Tax=Bactrocera tryoni TaxID=59916 RepID=UPI001A974C8A|nr:uncharacterized protein LOC120773508 [Bactrocera tryoni]